LKTLTIKSPEDGAEMVLRPTTRTTEETEFEVSVRTPWFTGLGAASTFMNGSPSRLFAEMAKEWTGWKGEKSWEDLEQRLILTGRSDSTGHIELKIQLNGMTYEDKLQIVLRLHAGQLEKIAQEARELLG